MWGRHAIVCRVLYLCCACHVVYIPIIAPPNTSIIQMSEPRIFFFSRTTNFFTISFAAISYLTRHIGYIFIFSTFYYETARAVVEHVAHKMFFLHPRWPAVRFPPYPPIVFALNALYSFFSGTFFHANSQRCSRRLCIYLFNIHNLTFHLERGGVIVPLCISHTYVRTYRTLHTTTSFSFQFSFSGSLIASTRDALVACQSHSLFISLNLN